MKDRQRRSICIFFSENEVSGIEHIFKNKSKKTFLEEDWNPRTERVYYVLGKLIQNG